MEIILLSGHVSSSQSSIQLDTTYYFEVCMCMRVCV